MQRLCSNPRVGVSRPVPNGTFTQPLSPGCREAMALPFRLSPETPGTPVAGGSVRGPRQRSPGSGTTRASDGSRGTPTTRQRWWGRERSDRIRTRSAAMGEGAQRPKNRRLCRPPKRSEVPVFLMPFSFVRRIWSFSGRSAGFLLVHQRKVASTARFQPDHLWFPLVEGRVEVTPLSADFGLLAFHRVLRCVAPGGKRAAEQRYGVCDEGAGTG